MKGEADPSAREVPVFGPPGGSRPPADTDRVAVEEPLQIMVQGERLCVTMRTPGDDGELAAGFLFCEGVVAAPSDIASIEVAPARDRNVVHVTLSHGEEGDAASQTRRPPASAARRLFVSSSCGVCGKDSIEAVMRAVAPVQGDGCIVESRRLCGMVEEMRAAQRAFTATGGLHAAAIFTATGGLVAVREDVGRHNAVDKAIGRALQAGLLPLERHVLIVSGRLSFEIIQKAAAASLPVVAGVSAPSSLAVELAKEAGITLAGFVRGGRFNVYSHPRRVEWGQ